MIAGETEHTHRLIMIKDIFNCLVGCLLEGQRERKERERRLRREVERERRLREVMLRHAMDEPNRRVALLER